MTDYHYISFQSTMERDVTASQHKHWRTTQERVEKFISDNSFKDVNLRGKLYPRAKEVDSKLIITGLGIIAV